MMMWQKRAVAVLRQGGGRAVAPKPEPCPPNVLVTAAHAAANSYTRGFFGLQNMPKCVSV